MRLLAIALATLIAVIQHPLWFGKGGWMRVWEVQGLIRAQQEENAVLQARNSALDAEVRDLKHGLEAIEERARSELGMIRRDEIFFHVVGSGGEQAPSKNREAR